MARLTIHPPSLATIFAMVVLAFAVWNLAVGSTGLAVAETVVAAGAAIYGIGFWRRR